MAAQRIAENGVAQDLNDCVRASFPLIYIESAEEVRVELAVQEIAKRRNMKLYFWGVSRGFVDADDQVVEATTDPVDALRKVAEGMKTEEPAEPGATPKPKGQLFVLRDFHRYLDDPVVARWLRDLAVTLRSVDRNLIILSPVYKVPAELEKDFALLQWPLPSRPQIDNILGALLSGVPSGVRDGAFADARPQVVEALTGLTSTEVENIAAKCLVQQGAFKVAPLLAAKKEIVRKSGVLEFSEASTSLDDVGGLDLLKAWLVRKRRAFSDEARAFGIDVPRGVLIVGMPGGGKTLCAKAISAAWGTPLVRMDFARLLGSLVGESEGKLLQAIKTIESVAPAVLLIDEIEKSVAGAGSDLSGVSTRMLGTLLQWLNDKTSPVFVVATANQIESLPPELLRKGRFDELWFVDLPNRVEREAIFATHLRKRRRDPTGFDLKVLAEQSNNLVGAEIEQVVIEGLGAAFDESRELTQADLERCIREVVPLAVTMKGRITALREWANGRARPASTPEATAQAERTGRALDLDRN